MDINKIGRQIAALRKELGYTQENLAEILNISPQAVSKWENGHALPETVLLPNLAKALGTSIDSLLTDSKIQILSAFYGDGIESYNVAKRLNKLIQNDNLDIMVNALTLACPLDNNRPKYLILKYQIEQNIYYTFADEDSQLTIDLNSKRFRNAESVLIIAASYGTAKAKYDVMLKIEHYNLFNWNEYHADHETFPSDPNNDDKDYLTFVYLNKDGIHLVTCEENESIAYNIDKTELYRKQDENEYFIPNVPLLPEFGKGMECSWAAALTAALQAMHIKTTYEHVMGVSGACYRLAFCSPRWDYSSVDGLVAYDYAMPGYKAFGFTPDFAERIDKEARAEERKHMINEIRHNMPVLGINLRVAPEWGVICGYKNNGSDLFCRTKYDSEIHNSSGYEKGKYNPYDYLFVDNWPFIITYFSDMTPPPTPKENLVNSLRVFADCTKQEIGRGYAMGLKAYEVWQIDLLDEAWYENNDDEQFARRLSVNQFCSLALFDARKSAYIYLSDNKSFLSDKADSMEQIIKYFYDISEMAGQIHKLLGSEEHYKGARAREFWTMEMRIRQAELLSQMLDSERKAMFIAEKIIYNIG
ncbi:helix-turn-helix domain-containing protein [Anaerocolumna sp. MB42-C2]|uniref:helix-turn-helix domain-containing protein n=1 Tax=Anaerocolumna sp. MB42-C2 TaxID=3070997 RepID=UPI0027E0AE69|nr:helix-turn-helix transcriptional regulator [Anaerocolumna sp. MB42-C2]WMJ90013.1 helix-turn-helix transcriptional regulator [Anaerocolumna sp. MB42-C2]